MASSDGQIEANVKSAIGTLPTAIGLPSLRKADKSSRIEAKQIPMQRMSIRTSLLMATLCKARKNACHYGWQFIAVGHEVQVTDSGSAAAGDQAFAVVIVVVSLACHTVIAGFQFLCLRSSGNTKTPKTSFLSLSVWFLKSPIGLLINSPGGQGAGIMWASIFWCALLDCGIRQPMLLSIDAWDYERASFTRPIASAH